MKKRGKIFILVGPPSVGKNTLMEGACDFFEGLIRMPSVTTREKRAGEKDGIDKFFLTKQEFDERINKDDFLEWQIIHGYKYGVLKSVIEDRISQGKDYIADIEVLGAMEIKKEYKEDAVLIFVVPPSLEEIRKRIEKRGTESQDEIEIRLQRSKAELVFVNKCDQILLNDDLDVAIKELLEIIDNINNPENKKQRFNIRSVGVIVDQKKEQILVDDKVGLKLFHLGKNSFPHQKIIDKLSNESGQFKIVDESDLIRKNNKGLDVPQPIWVDFDINNFFIIFYYLIEAVEIESNNWLKLSQLEDYLENKNSSKQIIETIKNFKKEL